MATVSGVFDPLKLLLWIYLSSGLQILVVNGQAGCVSSKNINGIMYNFTCKCSPCFSEDGRGSTGGSGCTDILSVSAFGVDSCADNCANTQRGFQCDGIEECTIDIDDCVGAATCRNINGTFTCTCSPGFIGDGIGSGNGCIDMNDCMEISCVLDGFNCTSTPGIIQCDEPITIASAPDNVIATPNTTFIDLSWTQQENDYIDSFEISYSYQGPCFIGHMMPVQITISDSTSVIELEEFSDYIITITAVNRAGRSPTSTIAVTTLQTAPSGPPLSLTNTSTNVSSFTIEWSRVNCLDRNSEITGYRVRYYQSESPTSTVTEVNISGVMDRNMFTITGLNPSTSYNIEVRVVNRENQLGPSDKIEVTTTSKKIIPVKPSISRIFITTGEQPRLLHPTNLTCEATGVPPPTYVWYRDSEKIEEETRAHLYIERFLPEDRGYYHCEATNINGSDVSERLLLKIQGIRQYLVELTTQFLNNTDTEENIAFQLNSKLFGFNISADVYQVNIVYSTNTTTVVTLLVTLNLNQSVSSDLIEEAINATLHQNTLNFVSANIDSISILRFDGCPQLKNEPIDSLFPDITFTWQETEIGDNVSYTCPCQNLTSTKESATNTGSRMCGGNYSSGALWEPVNVIEDCGLSTITLQLCQAQMVAASNPEFLSEVLVNVTSMTEEIQAVDISAATTLIEELTDEVTNVENEEVRENFLRTIDNIIQADDEEVAQSQDNTKTSTRLLTTINNFADKVEVPNNTNSTTFVQRSYAIRVTNIDTNEFNGETLTFDLGTTDNVVSGQSTINSDGINSATGTEGDIGGGVTAAVRVPKSIFQELGVNDSVAQRLSYSVFTQGSLFQSSDVNQSNLTLGSVVVSIRVSGTQDTQMLTTPIEVLFQPSQLRDNATDTLCALWNSTSNEGRGAWSTDNCALVEEDTGLVDDVSQTNNQRSKQADIMSDGNLPDDRENVQVHYSQPGHFGLLLDLTFGVVEPPPEVFSFALQVISYIGLCVSLICLTVFLLTYLTTRQLRTNEHGQILINMSFALMCLYIMFLIGAHAVPEPVICAISAALLQYFMLVYFTWTTVEAFYLYKKLVKVLGTYIPKFVLKAGLTAWLLPWIIVILSVGPGYKSYYRDKTSPGFCRAIGLPFWLGTILPFAVTYVFNWIMFILIIVSLCHNTRSKFDKESNKDRVKFVKKQVTIAFGLATLFGLGWGFGLAASGTTVHSLTLAFQIIFSIFVGCQGVLFFILHGIKKQEARNQWKVWFTTITSKPVQLYSGSKFTSTATGTHSTINMSTLRKEEMLSQKIKREMESVLEKKGPSSQNPALDKQEKPTSEANPEETGQQKLLLDSIIQSEKKK